MAASMQHVARLQSRLKTLLSISRDIQKHTSVFPYYFKNCCFTTSNIYASFQSSRSFVTAHNDFCLTTKVPPHVDKATKGLPQYKERVTSDTLTIILPDVVKGTTTDELNNFFSNFGAVKSVTVEEKNIVAHVLLKNADDAIKLVNMKETNFRDRVVQFSKLTEAADKDVLSRTVVIKKLNPLTEAKDLITFLKAFEIEDCRLLQEDLDSGFMKFQTPEEAEMFIILSQEHPDFEIKGKNIEFNINPEYPDVVCATNLDKKTSAEELCTACHKFFPANRSPECWRPQLLKGLVRIKFSDKKDAQLFFEEKANDLQFRDQHLHAKIQETEMLAVESTTKLAVEPTTKLAVEPTTKSEPHHEHKFSYAKVGLTYASRVLVQPGENTDLYIESEGNSFKIAQESAVNKARYFWQEIRKGEKSLNDITEDDLKEIFSDASRITVSVDEEGNRKGMKTNSRC